MINTRYENVEDFLIDNTFQQYCSGENKQCVLYWNNYLLNHPEQTETIMQAKRLFHILVGNKKPLHTQVEKLKTEIEASSLSSPIKKFRLPIWVKTVAALTVMTVGIYWTMQRWKPEPTTIDHSAITYTTANGEKKVLQLTDGSKIILNAGSRLSLEEGFNKSERHVHLTGEAFFDVREDKNKPFIVHTQDFDIRVLGTSFNVKAYPEESTSEAILIEGLIEMHSKRGSENSMIIKPNQKVIVYKAIETPDKTASIRKIKKSPLKEIAIQEVAAEDEQMLLADVAWKENRLEIVDQDFASLKKVLERWYNVEIELNGQQLEDIRFTATFNKEGIEQVLDALKKVQPFNYKIYGKKITIYE